MRFCWFEFTLSWTSEIRPRHEYQRKLERGLSSSYQLVPHRRTLTSQTQDTGKYGHSPPRTERMDSGSHVISHTNCAHTMAGPTNPHPSTPFGCVGRFVGFSHSQHGRRGSVRGPPWRAGGALFPELRTVCIFLGGACAAGGSAGCCVRSVFLSVVGGPALFVALLGVHTHALTQCAAQAGIAQCGALWGCALYGGHTRSLAHTHRRLALP